MMHTDPPAHTRYRRLVQPGFKPSVVRALEPAVRARARDLVARLGDGSARRRGPPAVGPAPPAGDQRDHGPAGGGLGALLRVVRGRDPRGHRLARGAPEPAAGRDDHLPRRPDRAAPLGAPPRRPHRAGRGRDRRGPALRRRAGHVPRPAPGGRERDDAEPPLRRPGGPRRAPRPVGATGGRPRPRPRRRRGDAAMDHPGGLVHADGHAPDGARRGDHRRRRARPHGLRLGQPRRGRLRSDERRPSTSGATPTRTSPSATAPTSVWERPWPAWRAGSSSRSSSTGSTRWSPPATWNAPARR